MTIKYGCRGEVNLVAIVTGDAVYVQEFIQSLQLPQAVAEGCLFSERCCKSFYVGFYGNNRYIVDDLLDYREDKIKNSQITLDLFLEMCYTVNMLEVFTKTFYQSFTIADMDIIGQAISSGRASLETIYTDFENNPNKNILRNLK